MNFDHCPLLVVWEVTQACDLTCVNCRPCLRDQLDPEELSTEQGFRLIDQVRSFGNPLLVLTGGDPLKRPDLFELIRYSASVGLRTNITPSATPLLTRQIIDRFKEVGIARMAIALDGPDAATHNAFRQVNGNFECAVAALCRAHEIGLETQVHTSVTRHNRALLGEIGQRVFESGALLWNLFFPLDTQEFTPQEYEQIFGTLYALSKIAPFDIRTTEALHYRRFIAQAKQRELGRRAGLRNPGVGEARGFAFVSHRGEVFPSGFLPVSAGNVVRDSLPEVYRNSAVFRVLRDPEALRGRCGRCEYNEICGGSRARAYAVTGDYLAEDPSCGYSNSRLV